MSEWRPPGIRKERRGRAPSLVTAIDIDGTTLRLVQSPARGNVNRVLTEPLEFPPDADRNEPGVLGSGIRSALSRLRIKPASVVMGVPRARVVLRTVLVPVMDKLPELASMVHFQVAKDLPFPMDEAVVDFKVRREILPAQKALEKNGLSEGTPDTQPVTPRLEVLVAVLKRDVVEHYQKVAEAAGIRLNALGLLPYANARCIAACHVADGDDAFALVTLRPDEVGVDVIAQEALLFSRGAMLRSAGSDSASTSSEGSPASGDAFVRSVVIEVVRSLHGYGGQEGIPAVAKLVIAGATGQESEVAAALLERLNIACSVLDPGKSLGLPEEGKNSPTGSIGALGLALGMNDPAGLPFDFLSPKQPAVQRDLRRIRILGGIGAAVLLLVSVVTLRSFLIRRHTDTLNATLTELADAEKKRPLYLKVISQSASVDEWIRSGRDWLEHYAYLTSILPPSDEIYVTSLAVSGQGAIRLAVQARSGETLARLDKQLRAAGYEVKPLAITPGADRFGYEFRSNVELIIPSKLKIDLHKVKPAPRPSDDVSLDPNAYRRVGA